MRFLSVISAVLCINSSSQAQDEVRMGVSKNDWKGAWSHKHEKGVAVNFEYLVAPWNTGIGNYIFTPRPHMGMSISTHAGTSQLYVGFTWRVNFKSFFIEPGFGGEIHNAHLKRATSQKKALGARLLFRESISIGYQLSERQSVSIMLDHASNAGIVKPNGGINTFGVRYGYKL